VSNRRRLRDKTSRHDLRLTAEVQAHVDSFEHYKHGQRYNTYRCESCSGEVLTLDVDNGVTPANIACYATETCHARAWSQWYNATLEEGAQPVLEWYRPTTLRGLNDYEREHVTQGGLLHRPGPGAPDWVRAAHGLPAGA
jgi:hypothetical protein